MKLFLVLIFLFMQIGCVTYGKFYVEASPRYDVLKQDFFINDVFTTASIQEADFQGLGGQFSLITISDHLYSRVGAFINNLKTDNFAYSANGTNYQSTVTQLKTTGFDFDLGLHFWHFTPYISAVYSRMKFDPENPAYQLGNFLPEENIFVSNYISQLAIGLAIDIPISKRWNIFINSRFAEDSQSYSIGLLIGGWDFGDKKEAQRESSRSSRKKK